ATAIESSTGYHISKTKGNPRVTTSPAFVEGYGPNNAVERQYAFDVVRALAASWEAGELECFDEVCARLAPVGPKRMLHAFFAERVPEFAFKHELPPPALVHPADLSEVAVDALLPHVQIAQGQHSPKDALNKA